MGALNGVNNHNAVLTKEMVKKLRAEYVPWVNGYKKLSIKYNIPIMTIRDCVTYHTYKNVY